MPDLEISKLPSLAGSQLQATDPFPVADLSASETKKVTLKDLVQAGVALIDPKSIPVDKVDFVLPPGSVGTNELAPDSVTAAKLADNSSAVVGGAVPAAGDFVGQMAYDTADGRLVIWTGSTWAKPKAAGSVNAVVADTTGVVVIQTVQTGDSVQLDGKLADTTAAKQFLAGPTSNGGVVAYRAIAGADLPVATAVDLGGVSINGDGLRLAAGGVVQIANDVVASTTAQLVSYDAKGLVTAGHDIGSNDLPPATQAARGAVFPGPSLAVTVAGELDHKNIIAPGTGTKVSYDLHGHITTATALAEIDIPDISAAKITSGTLDAGRIGDRSITGAMLADYSLAYIQENVPPAGVGAHPIGMTWLQESTGQVSVWNGNSWMKTGASTLFNKNLRYAGTYNAATGLVTGVTQFGTAEGFKINDAIPAADDKIAGIYFVASTPGTSASIAGGAAFDAGDWLLCHGTTGGWVRIDTLNGAGGGGSSTSHLDDLLDVTLTAVVADQLLVSAASGQWVNKPIASILPSASDTAKGIVQLATQAEVDAGTDALKAVTPKTLQDCVLMGGTY